MLNEQINQHYEELKELNSLKDFKMATPSFDEKSHDTNNRESYKKVEVISMYSR